MAPILIFKELPFRLHFILFDYHVRQKSGSDMCSPGSIRHGLPPLGGLPSPKVRSFDRNNGFNRILPYSYLYVGDSQSH